MRLPFRKKDKKKSGRTSPIPDEFLPTRIGLDPNVFPPSRFSAQLLAALPPRVLARIFTFVCPHALDESYETCEESAEKGCMLCDLRDLSRCVQVNRAWRETAVQILYHSVRIDPVHYCKLEAYLAERRKKKSRFDRNGIPEDPALARLRLLRRTVRDDPTRLGKTVQFLKTPYMIRESYHVELAQTIAVLPNLKYVDLPEGMFSDEPAYATLRLEVQARCPNLRKATFVGGAENSFSALRSGQIWQRLEVLELRQLKVDPKILRGVLTSLPHLRALKVAETYSLSDEVLAPDENLPPLPALEELIVKDTPSLTSVGLMDYLSFYETQKSLRVLTLKDTGIQPWMLQEVLAMAPSLKTLAIQATIRDPFPSSAGVQPLMHKRIRTFRYEISADASAGPFATQAYYSYLSNSVSAGYLPRLRRLYVLDEQFPNLLQNAKPSTPIGSAAGGGGERLRSESNSSVSYCPPSVRVCPPGNVSLSPTRRNNNDKNDKNDNRMPNPDHSKKRLSSNNPFAQAAAGGWRGAAGSGPRLRQTLEVYTKNLDSGQWNFSPVSPFMSSAPTVRHRATSSFGLAADVAGQGWDRGEARRSVLIGNGTGSFLPIPKGQGPQETFSLGPVPAPGGSDYSRPQSSGGIRNDRNRTMWK
ncbi:hypothetical protein E4U43_006152 [Claviceps pusilla]|uniref:F-box domain-containing protein n=1 Tax=Claviceps pusilla TaxID=123648 RepID=A0A9P7NDY6_9HYPO|nr:hypothetical protein E4U43_006152 [Claviceps pusilla]